MLSVTTAVLLSLGLYGAYSNYVGLSRNIAAAKRSGLPYIILPFDTYATLWRVTFKWWYPILAKLPRRLVGNWLPFMHPEWPWHLLCEPNDRIGDVFMTVAPLRIRVWVSNAEAINQVTSRRDEFKKPLEDYKILDVYGSNLISTEGHEWRQHRKIISPSFNEKNNTMAFVEACCQAKFVLKKWTKEDIVKSIPEDSRRLTLHIISMVGFGIRICWRGEALPEGTEKSTRYASNHPEGDHTLPFGDALGLIMDRLLWILLFPKWLLRVLPSKSAREGYESYVNWTKYMEEMFIYNIGEAQKDSKTENEGMDLMGSLVRSSYGKSKDKITAKLTDEEIRSNTFMFLLAGHETTANSIHFCLMQLAINPFYQRQVQEEIQQTFGNTPIEEWDYEAKINNLLGGICGAVLNEQLRLIPPILMIPKQVGTAHDQDLIIDGRRATIPSGAMVSLNILSPQRDPRYWPSQPSKITLGQNDLSDFRPDRWLLQDKSSKATDQINGTGSSVEDRLGGFTGSDSHEKLYRPVKGSYFPFSLGMRSCLGRRMAQVEVMAVLAVIFQNHSMELDVSEWATDHEVAQMTPPDKALLYKKAQDKARASILGAEQDLTMRLPHPGFIPIKLVEKGSERFLHLVDLVEEL